MVAMACDAETAEVVVAAATLRGSTKAPATDSVTTAERTSIVLRRLGRLAMDGMLVWSTRSGQRDADEHRDTCFATGRFLSQ